MPLRIVRTAQFKRDYKRLSKQGADLDGLIALIRQLSNQDVLDHRYLDHPLKGNWHSYRECHVRPDLLLIYRVKEDELQLTRAGSHSELFRR